MLTPRRFAGILVLLALVCLEGCRGRPAPADQDAAIKSLRIALQAWQRGDDLQALREQSPPIYFNEPDCETGIKLVSFKMADKAEYFGRQVRCSVNLSLQNKSGDSYEKKTDYLIDTWKRIVIVRESL